MTIVFNPSIAATETILSSPRDGGEVAGKYMHTQTLVHVSVLLWWCLRQVVNDKSKDNRIIERSNDRMKDVSVES